MKETIQRAPFSPELLEIGNFLKDTILPILNQPQSYGSIYLERKKTKRYGCDFKNQTASETDSFGIVLRLYDGVTLHEKATNDFDSKLLETLAHQLVENSKKKWKGKIPSWKERLTTELDPEIRSQIPSNPSSADFVHFGIRYQKDPLQSSSKDYFSLLEQVLDRTKKILKKIEWSLDSISYATARGTFRIEETLYLDSEVALSQTLYRTSLALTLMSGAQSVRIPVGGLGGMECWEISDSTIESLLRDLKDLTEAERLQPGKYKVIFSPSLSGVLAHEAFGHSQEGDTCARQRSKAWELYQEGTLAGNQEATILNNPAIYQNADEPYAAWGSYFFDEEGWFAQKHFLLNKGRLGTPMTHFTSSEQLSIPRTANGKRESWSHGIYTRQTNTYFSEGTLTLDELMEKMGDGFIATACAGGMEDPKGMGIQVGIGYLREVKNGKPTSRVFVGPTGGFLQMTGETTEVLQSILGKTKIEAHLKTPDTASHPFNEVGGCGKYHKEFVYAGCGGPYLLLENVLLG
tara:strand:+ start:334 stop:1893 length:1560 start_codon:yes stop_codon:yes gene_type:complete